MTVRLLDFLDINQKDTVIVLSEGEGKLPVEEMEGYDPIFDINNTSGNRVILNFSEGLEIRKVLGKDHSEYVDGIRKYYCIFQLPRKYTFLRLFKCYLRSRKILKNAARSSNPILYANIQNFLFVSDLFPYTQETSRNGSYLLLIKQYLRHLNYIRKALPHIDFLVFDISA